jgi:predicted RNA binding protein YcfA (HicA-like mRNA interferase family)
VKVISGKTVLPHIGLKGWELKRTNESHHIFTKVENIARISVPVHGNSPLKIRIADALYENCGD